MHKLYLIIQTVCLPSSLLCKCGHYTEIKENKFFGNSFFSEHRESFQLYIFANEPVQLKDYTFEKERKTKTTLPKWKEREKKFVFRSKILHFQP